MAITQVLAGCPHMWRKRNSCCYLWRHKQVKCLVCLLPGHLWLFSSLISKSQFNMVQQMNATSIVAGGKHHQACDWLTCYFLCLLAFYPGIRHDHYLDKNNLSRWHVSSPDTNPCKCWKKLHVWTGYLTVWNMNNNLDYCSNDKYFQ